MTARIVRMAVFALSITGLAFALPPGSDHGVSQKSKGKGRGTNKVPAPLPAGDVIAMSLEVEVLRSLYGMEVTPAQAAALGKFASETCDKPRIRKPAKASDKFRRGAGRFPQGFDRRAAGQDRRNGRQARRRPRRRFARPRRRFRHHAGGPSPRSGSAAVAQRPTSRSLRSRRRRRHHRPLRTASRCDQRCARSRRTIGQRFATRLPGLSAKRWAASMPKRSPRSRKKLPHCSIAPEVYHRRNSPVRRSNWTRPRRRSWELSARWTCCNTRWNCNLARQLSNPQAANAIAALAAKTK